MSFTFEMPSYLNKKLNELDQFIMDNQCIDINCEKNPTPEIGDIDSTFLLLYKDLRQEMNISFNSFFLDYIGHRKISQQFLPHAIILLYLERLFQTENCSGKRVKEQLLNANKPYKQFKSLRFSVKESKQSINYKTISDILDNLKSSGLCISYNDEDCKNSNFGKLLSAIVEAAKTLPSTTEENNSNKNLASAADNGETLKVVSKEEEKKKENEKKKKVETHKLIRCSVAIDIDVIELLDKIASLLSLRINFHRYRNFKASDLVINPLVSSTINILVKPCTSTVNDFLILYSREDCITSLNSRLNKDGRMKNIENIPSTEVTKISEDIKQYVSVLGLTSAVLENIKSKMKGAMLQSIYQANATSIPQKSNANNTTSSYYPHTNTNPTNIRNSNFNSLPGNQTYYPLYNQQPKYNI